MDIICRTCLAYDDGLEPLFSKKLVDTDYHDLTTMILLCTGLEISEDDKLSNTICTQCIESIIAAFKYREKARHSNTILLETKNMMKDEVNNYIEPKKERFKAEITESKITTSYVESKCEPFGIEITDSSSLSDVPDIEEIKCYEIHPKPALNDYNRYKYKGEVTDRSNTKVQESYIELGPDDTINIAQLKTTLPDEKSFILMDKYIRVADKSTTTRPYSCTICNQTYEIIGPLRKHMLTNHNISAMKTFRCRACFKTFVGERYFRRHLKEAHQPVSMKQNHVCDLCGKAFKNASGLLEHINRHTGNKSFKCEICEYASVTLSALKVHIRSHTGEKPYVCHICGAGYKSSSHRGTHIRDAHSDGRPYECIICTKTFKSRRVYVSHKQIHSTNQHIKCDICNKEFNYSKNLKVHMRQHGEKTFKCNVCEKTFHQKQNCQTHMKKVHGA